MQRLTELVTENCSNPFYRFNEKSGIDIRYRYCIGVEKAIDKLAEYEDLGSVEYIKELINSDKDQHYLAYKHIEPQIRGCLDRERVLTKELEVYKKAFQKIGLHYFNKDLYRTAREQWLNSWLEQARKELEDVKD